MNKDLSLNDTFPIGLYDNNCYVCSKFAQIVSFLSRRSIIMVGHYTDEGQKVIERLDHPNAFEMFWFINGKRAYGGRAALLPMIKRMFKPSNSCKPVLFAKTNPCSTQCKTVKSVFLRSMSIMKNSETIDLDKSEKS